MSLAPSYRPELLALPAEGSTSKVTLVSSSADSDSATTAATTTTVPALDASNAALKFRVPGAAQAYDVSVDGSAPLCMNLPDPWWWQGDAGNSSTPDGWLRVFGSVRHVATALDVPAAGSATSRLRF